MYYTYTLYGKQSPERGFELLYIELEMPEISLKKKSLGNC